MPDEIETNDVSRRVRQSTKIFVRIGVPAVLFTAVLTARLVWEETALTIRQGPQMIGFSLMHGPYAMIVLAPVILLVWFVIALIVLGISLWRKRSLSKWYWATFASAILIGGMLSLPGTFWQWIFIGSFAKSAHSADLMCDAAAEGSEKTVLAYLDHGVPIEAINYEGSTAMFTAAAGGSVPVLRLLLSKGANINATNSFGDSPLEAASENQNSAAIDFLKDHGAAQIAGTSEQRKAASHAIVQKQMMEHSNSK